MKKIEEWLGHEKEREGEITSFAGDIRYDVENFLKGIRYHTDRFKKEIDADPGELTGFLEKPQYLSSGEFIKEIERQINNIRSGIGIPVAFLLLGNSLFFMREYELASRCYERSISYFENVPPFYNNMGCCYYKQKRWIKAKRMFEKALELNPDYKDARLNLEKAREAYANQKRVDYWMAKGNTYFSQQRWEQAERCYEKALAAGGDMPETLVNLGNICFQRKEDARAEEYYMKAIHEDADFAHAYSSLGKLRLRQGRLEEAFENLQKAFELDPSHHDSLALMGDISFRWGNYPQALELYEAYLKLHPDSQTTLMCIGDCYLKMGKKDAARVAYERLSAEGMASEALKTRLELVRE